MFRTCLRDARSFVRPFAYDVATEDLAPLLPEDLEEVFYPRTYGWDPSLSRAISSKSSLICATLVWLDAEGLSYPRFGVEHEGRTYIVSEELNAPGASDCPGLPRADFPTWSPDGRHIAFWFSPTELEGQSRLDAPWSLQLLDPDSLETRELLSGVTHPTGAQWSPDNAQLAFSGVINAQAGTWSFSLETGELRRVEPFDLKDLEWSPDGDQLIGIPPGLAKTRLVLIQV